jgi:beta-glucosidase
LKCLLLLESRRSNSRVREFPALEPAALISHATYSTQHPLHNLGFVKKFLKAGESTTITFPLTSRDLSIWDEVSHSWAAQPGVFTAHVGASSRDIRQVTTFNN